MKNRTKVALVVSHPIQHFCPQYVSFSKIEGVDFKVFFASTLGLKKYMDPNFKREISWGNLRLEEFNHVFLNDGKVITSDEKIDAPDLDDALKGFGPEVVIIYGYFQKLQRRAHRWARTNNTSLAYISDSELRHKRNPLRELVKYPFLRNFFSGISHFLSVGDANEAFYRKYGVGKDRIVRMHFPIDISLYESCFDRKQELSRAIRTKFGIAESELIIAVVGKLASWKNQGHIIEAMKILEAEGFLLHLFVIGSGQTENELHELAASLKQSKVHFPGFVNIDELPSYYSATDIYVHPASLEPHSIAVSEAIYMGCPVILSNTCGSYGPTDDVQEGINGYIFEFGNIAELARTIKRLAQDEATRLSFGKASHNRSVGFQQRAHQGVMHDLKNRLNESN